ncbi:methyltransferase domain-containing protein [Phenylobacterium hankyongense]|nr:methyltransferase domain-containing protein [Phenylobacterium hankyongense]
MPRPIRTAGVLSLYVLQVLPRVTGTRPRECTCCGYVGRFGMYGHPPRYDARCPECGSLERQRLIVLAMERARLLRADDRVLYFTPERPLANYLRARVGPFEPAGLRDSEQLEAQDGAFNVVVASNILEHADDDRRALAELKRVLSPGGRLIITVPLVQGWESTYENPSVRTEEERAHHFGERNHLRFYGRDVGDRIRDAGFTVDEHIATGEESVRYGLIRGDHVFIARKPLRQPKSDAAESSGRTTRNPRAKVGVLTTGQGLRAQRR